MSRSGLCSPKTQARCLQPCLCPRGPAFRPRPGAQQALRLQHHELPPCPPRPKGPRDSEWTAEQPPDALQVMGFLVTP